jgi:hypothetical protein
MPVVVIPTNLPNIRADLPLQLYPVRTNENFDEMFIAVSLLVYFFYNL